MGRGMAEYARDFVRNLRTEPLSRRWLRRVVGNRLRARIALGCCGHPGQPGC